MFKSIKSVALIAVLVTTAVAASASTQTSPASAGYSWNHGNFEKVVALKDGSTLHEYSDGKMAVESSYGKAVFKPIGQVVQAMDGSAITICSNDVARLSSQLKLHR